MTSQQRGARPSQQPTPQSMVLPLRRQQQQQQQQRQRAQPRQQELLLVAQMWRWQQRLSRQPWQQRQPVW